MAIDTGHLHLVATDDVIRVTLRVMVKGTLFIDVHGNTSLYLRCCIGLREPRKGQFDLGGTRPGGRDQEIRSKALLGVRGTRALQLPGASLTPTELVCPVGLLLVTVGARARSRRSPGR